MSRPRISRWPSAFTPVATSACTFTSRPELWCRGPNVVRGYLNNPGATTAAVDDEGWLHAGDLVTVDADGAFHVVDRLEEMIKYKGNQVAPAELEAVLLTHDGVADAAVVGVRDGRGRGGSEGLRRAVGHRPRDRRGRGVAFDAVAPGGEVSRRMGWFGA